MPGSLAINAGFDFAATNFIFSFMKVVVGFVDMLEFGVDVFDGQVGAHWQLAQLCQPVQNQVLQFLFGIHVDLS